MSFPDDGLLPNRAGDFVRLQIENERLKEIIAKQTEALRWYEKISSKCYFCGVNAWTGDNHKPNCLYNQAITLGEEALNEKGSCTK
jgi:hypothetical protein